ncbi:hypothetical protein Asal01_01668 [Fodinibius salicampi]
MKTVLTKYCLPGLLTFLLVSSLIFLNFNKEGSQNGISFGVISKPDTFEVNSPSLRSIGFNNNLSISKQAFTLIGTSQVASGKDRTDTTDTLKSHYYNDMGSNNEYKQLKANSPFNDQVVTQVGYSNYAGHSVLNNSFSDLVICSIGNQNTAVQNILNGYYNSLMVTQNGSSNAAYQDIAFEGLTNIANINNALQTGYNNWIKSSQTGRNNSIDAVQNGDSNWVNIEQIGNNNEATIRQSGKGNTVEINQN